MSRTNYIFIDYENVQETELDRIAGKPVQVVLVLGERHKSLPIGLVKLIQKYAAQVRLVETELNGKNALDFVLAYEVGVAAEKDRNGFFHVLSKDKGFDKLIIHLKSQGVFGARHESFSEIPVLKKPDDRVAVTTTFFKNTKAARAKKRKTLESQIQSLFGKTLTPAEVEETIQGLIREKVTPFQRQVRCLTGSDFFTRREERGRHRQFAQAAWMRGSLRSKRYMIWL